MAVGKDSASRATATDYFIAGKNSANANLDRITAEINRILDPIVQTCGKLPGRLKSYLAQLLQHIYQDLREELNRDDVTRKRKGLPTAEDKIDNALTMLVSIYDRLKQLEDAIQPDTPKNGQSAHGQGRISARGENGRGISVKGKPEKLGIIEWLQSVWSSVRQLWVKQSIRRYCNPYIVCAVGISHLYFVLSIFSWVQWHHYRDENTSLRFAADKYRVDSVILRELYPQAATTLSSYEHIIKNEGADKAIEVFQDNLNKETSSTR